MTSTQTGGQLVVAALEDAGVTKCFGVPGESFMGILDALYDSSITFVSTRHEGGASFMAAGYAKATGHLGVCLGTRAVGSANMAIGIHEARQDSAPMIAIAGQVSRTQRGREGFQEIDLVAAMTPFAKWAVELHSAASAVEIMPRAINVAQSGRPGPVFVAVPQDVCDEAYAGAYQGPNKVVAPQPDPAAVARALDILLKAQRPLIFAGGGVLRSPDAYNRLITLAERIEVPVVTSWRHHDGFPNDHPLFLGSASLGSAPTVWDRLAEADAVLVLGNRLQEMSTAGYRLPAPGTRVVHIDIEPLVLVSHVRPELAIQADVGNALRQLLEQLPADVPGTDERVAGNRADRAAFVQATTRPAPHPLTEGVSYSDVLRVLESHLGPDALITSDAGNFYAWLSRYHRFTRPGTYFGPASGAMGYGMPAAIGAKLGTPERTVVSVSGDGGFMMSLAELDTAARYGANIIAVVLDNARHGTIRMHQEREHFGRIVGTDLAPTNLAQVALGLGVDGYLAEDAHAFEEAFEKALVSNRPTLIQVRMDRNQLSVERRLTDPSNSL